VEQSVGVQVPPSASIGQARARGSVGEHFVHTEGVVGSNPTVPISLRSLVLIGAWSKRFARFAWPSGHRFRGVSLSMAPLRFKSSDFALTIDDLEQITEGMPAGSQPSPTIHPSCSSGTEAQAGAPFRSTPETVASNTPPEPWLTASICSQVIAAR
jgi:hypothetical protein